MNIPSKPAAIASMPRQYPLCAHAVERILAGHPACAAPDRFDVYGCGGCDTGFAWPMVASSTIYEQIYRVAARLPGYDRYERLRAAAAVSDSPLDLLADREDVYWGVREALRPLLASGRRPRILEIGSGMGYLTFALHRAGCDIVGIDHSAEAVARATATFGPLFQVAPAESLAASGLGGFDAVVSTEVIEHLQDPQGFVRDAASLLAPGGVLVITTPNMDLYPRNLAWHTDPAPVHLWWFSKTSLRRIAWDCGLQPSFIDYSAVRTLPRACGRQQAAKPGRGRQHSISRFGAQHLRMGADEAFPGTGASRHQDLPRARGAPVRARALRPRKPLHLRRAARRRRAAGQPMAGREPAVNAGSLRSVRFAGWAAEDEKALQQEAGNDVGRHGQRAPDEGIEAQVQA